MNVDTSTLATAPVEEHQTMAHQPFFRKWGGLVVLSLALAIIIIDTTLLNVSLRTIISDLHTNLHSMQWVITIYSLILAAFTITGGRLGDLFGRRKMFAAGAIIFAVGSFLASVSTNIGMMIAGEAIIEGIGAAMMMPATASLLITNFKGRDRAVAFGVWGGIAAASSAIGPILGGWLTTNYSWRWGFRINVVVVALVLLGLFLIKENHDLRKRERVDYVGVLLSSLGLLSMVFGFIQASTYGWFKVKEALVIFHHTISFGSLSATPVFVLLGIIILIVFVFWERYRERSGGTPLVSLQLFKNRQFIVGASTMGILALGQAGLFFTIPVFLQAVRHLDALHTGLTLLPMSLTLLIGAPLSAFLVKYISPKHLVQAGVFLSAISFIVLRATLSTDSTIWSLSPGFILFGFGMGLMMAQISNLTLSAVSQEESGEASGVNNTLRMVGQTLGSAVLGAILLSTLTSHVTSGVDKSTVIPQQAKSQIESTVSSHISDISFGIGANPASNLPAAISNELNTITNNAVVESNKTVMVYGLLFIVLGLLVSIWLPNTKDLHAMEAGPSPAQAPPAAEPMSAAPASAMVVAETEVVQRKIRWRLYIPLAVLLLILILGGMALANNKSDNANQNAPEVVSYDSNQTATPKQPVITGDSNNSQAVSNAAENSNTNSTTITPSQAAPTSTIYSNSALHFSFDEPGDWKIVKDNGGEVVFKSPAAMYNIQSSNASGTMDQLKSFLQSQSNIHNVTTATFAGHQAYAFAIDGSYVSGYAFMEQGRLYYVLGVGSENTPLGAMKTF